MALHTLYSGHRLADCLGTLTEQDVLLVLDQAVQLLLDSTISWSALPCSVLALSEDVCISGVQIHPSVAQLVDYDQWVALTETQSQQVAWY
jgi:sulfur relay protein TusB/DsrH